MKTEMLTKSPIDPTIAAPNGNRPPSARTRSIGLLFAGVALMNAAMLVASAIATLFAAGAVGMAWSGVPNAAGVGGTAVGALWLSTVMSRRGRRRGLVTGYTLAVLGSMLGVGAIAMGSVTLLFVAMTLVGIGNGGAQLSRYAAAELSEPGRRSLVLSAIVWAGTIGTVIGSGAMSPAESAGMALGIDTHVAILLIPLVATALAAVVSLGISQGGHSSSSFHSHLAIFSGSRALLRPLRVKLAIVAMLAGQLTMVALMTMAPVYIHQHGEGMARVGIVLGLHTVGMFALSPLTGWIVDRFGSHRAIFMGLGTLMLSLLLVYATSTADDMMLPAGLFFLGYGWNLGFVGGSSLLVGRSHEPQQVRIQGLADAAVWGISALGTVGSGLLFAIGGYRVVLAASVMVLLTAAAALVWGRRALSVPGEPTHGDW